MLHIIKLSIVAGFVIASLINPARVDAAADQRNAAPVDVHAR